MKQILAAVLLVGLTLTSVMGAQAQDQVRVGIVDGRKVLLESTPGKKFQAEMKKMLEERQAKLDEEEKKIEAFRDAAERDKLLLNDKQKADKQRELEQKLSAYRKMRQEMQQQLAKREADVTREMSGQIDQIVTQIAKEEKLTLVLDRSRPSAIVWVDAPVDITDRVLKAYDAKSRK